MHLVIKPSIPFINELKSSVATLYCWATLAYFADMQISCDLGSKPGQISFNFLMETSLTFWNSPFGTSSHLLDTNKAHFVNRYSCKTCVIPHIPSSIGNAVARFSLASCFKTLKTFITISNNFLIWKVEKIIQIIYNEITSKFYLVRHSKTNNFLPLVKTSYEWYPCTFLMVMINA